MQTAVLVVVLGFLVLFAAMTFEVISRTGFDVLSGLALFFIALIATPADRRRCSARHPMTTDDRPAAPSAEAGAAAARRCGCCRWRCCSGCCCGSGLAALDSVPAGDDDRSAGWARRAAAPRSRPAAAARRGPHPAGRRRRASGRRASAWTCPAQDAVRLRFVRKPRAGLLFDVRTGRVLWRRNADRRLPIASLTKMMTALLIVEREDAHERVRITRRATRTAGSAIGVLPRGQEGAARGAPERPAARVRQRRRRRARPAQRRQRARLRAADERARRGDGPRLHAVLDSSRPEGRGQPLVRRRPRRACAGRPAPAPHQAHRAPQAGDPEVPDRGRAPVPLQQQPADAAAATGA